MLRAAVALADAAGIDSVSMRRLAQELGVVPMALYKHVANKEELLDGMVDVVIDEIDPPVPDLDWKSAVRQRILSARRALLRHPWARASIESRTAPTPAVLAYMDSMIGDVPGRRLLRRPHPPRHARAGQPHLRLHPGAVRRSRADQDPAEPEPPMAQQLAERYPNIAEIATAARTTTSVVGAGCDDQFEFEFALDLLLDGFERLRQEGWSSSRRRHTEPA